MNIVFLDIDGVLNYELFFEKGEYETFDDFCPDAVGNLNEIIKKTNSKIVIASAWRILHKEELPEIFRKNKIKEKIFGFTPVLHFEQRVLSVPRGCEIKEWLYQNKDLKITNYVIIDDSMDYLIDQQPHLFQCDPYCGLTPAISYKIINFLNKKV
jgi:hypothetical protein